MATYVVKSWRAAGQPDAQNVYVAILGREEGIVSFVLTLFGVEPTVSVTVSDARIEFAEASLSGQVRRIIPLTGVCSTLYGYYKPWKEALGVFFFSVGLSFSAANMAQSFGLFLFGGLVSAAIALVYYFLNRKLTLGFVENSGVASVIQFKRSVVENQEIGEAQAGYVCQIVQALIEARQRSILRV